MQNFLIKFVGDGKTFESKLSQRSLSDGLFRDFPFIKYYFRCEMSDEAIPFP